LQSAAVAPGVVKVSSERKTVQHLEGGIVKEILVRDGDVVEPGQVLIRLDDVTAKARVELLKRKRDSYSAMMARLDAERRGMEAIEFPQELLQRRDSQKIRSLINAEQQVFETRRDALQGEIDVLNQRIAQYEEQIAGLEMQIKSTATQLALIKEEQAAVEVLYKKGIYEKPKYLALKRNAANLEGQVGVHRSRIAEVNQQIAEVRLRIIDLKKQRSEQINGQLQKVQTELFDVNERLAAARDILERTEIRAPQDGTVVGLKVHTVEGVIGAGERILDIVPKNDTLIVETRVRPADIDIVYEGLNAEVRLTAFNMRTTPALPGKLTHISADSFPGTDGSAPYYRARVEIDPAHISDLELYPGMPAEVFLLTGERTVLSYLVRPIEDSIRRGLREE
jgi:HlyD family type I secretion membrane fusion protein